MSLKDIFYTLFIKAGFDSLDPDYVREHADKAE